MPRLESAIGHAGPLIDVRLRAVPEREAALNAAGLPIAPPFSVRGLLDTGATTTAIRYELADRLNLIPDDIAQIRSSASGPETYEAPVYQVRMTFGPIEAPDPPRWRTLDVVGVSIVTTGAFVLIGQDLLATCRFTYDGRKRRIMLSY